MIIIIEIIIIIIIIIFFLIKKKIDYLQIQEYEILKYIPYAHSSCVRKRIVVKWLSNNNNYNNNNNNGYNKGYPKPNLSL